MLSCFPKHFNQFRLPPQMYERECVVTPLPTVGIISFLNLKLVNMAFYNLNLYFLDYIQYLFFLHVECHSVSSVNLSINILVFSYLFVVSLYKAVLICCYICWNHFPSDLNSKKYCKHKETFIK